MTTRLPQWTVGDKLVKGKVIAEVTKKGPRQFKVVDWVFTDELYEKSKEANNLHCLFPELLMMCHKQEKELDDVSIGCEALAEIHSASPIYQGTAIARFVDVERANKKQQQFNAAMKMIEIGLLRLKELASDEGKA